MPGKAFLLYYVRHILFGETLVPEFHFVNTEFQLGTIFVNYMQIHTIIITCNDMQWHAITCKYIQVHAITCNQHVFTPHA